MCTETRDQKMYSVQKTEWPYIYINEQNKGVNR